MKWKKLQKVIEVTAKAVLAISALITSITAMLEVIFK